MSRPRPKATFVHRARKVKGAGWDVFQSNGSADGAMQICRIDDPRIDNADRCAFDHDGQAIKHVLRLAFLADEEAIDALWLVLDHDGLVNRILWCEAMGWTGRDAAAYPEGFNAAWPQFAVGESSS